MDGTADIKHTINLVFNHIGEDYGFNNIDYLNNVNYINYKNTKKWS